MFPVITKEIFTKYINSELVDGKQIVVQCETAFDHYRFSHLVSKKYSASWRSGQSLVGHIVFDTRTHHDDNVCYRRTFDQDDVRFTWCETSYYAQKPGDYVIFNINHTILDDLYV